MEAPVQEILDAILADQLDAVGELKVPQHYRGMTVHADEAEMFAELPSREKDPRKSLHSTRSPRPSSDPARHWSP